jgi:hypothetical protein
VTNPHDTLLQAYDFLQSGDRATAKRLLAAALRADSQNVQAWLWMSEAVDTEEQKRDCLLRALAIEPHNQAAQAELTRLERQALRGRPDRPVPAAAQGEALTPDHYRTVERNIRIAGGLLLTLLVGLAILGFALVRVVPQARDGWAPSSQYVLHTATLWCPSCERAGQPVVLSTRIGASFYQGAQASGLPHGTRVSVLRYRWSTLERRYYALVSAAGKRGWVPETQIRK